MDKGYSPWDRFYHKLNMIFNGIVASSMIPFALVFLQNQKENPSPVITEPLAVYTKPALILLCFVTLILANRMGPKWIAESRKETSIEDKLRVYLNQKIKHFALVEVAGILALVGFFLFKSQIFSFIYVGVLVVFSMYRPRFSRVSKEINETEEALISWSKGPEDEN